MRPGDRRVLRQMLQDFEQRVTFIADDMRDATPLLADIKRALERSLERVPRRIN